ncbi:MAG: FAD:protein FMN transferase [Synergistaceae bacterium]|nr:FAD:protein FMN transferase [Synergistaceae bacterium]
MKRKIFVVLILISCGLLSLALRQPEKISRAGFSMNTLINMTLYAEDANNKILDEAYDLLNKLDKELSMYDASSDISKINSAAGVQSVKVPDDVIEVLKKSLQVYELSDGIFNPLIGAVTKLWKINEIEDSFIPSKVSLDAAIKLSEIQNLEIDENTSEVFLKTQGCILDLGGIAKGYASDKIIDLFKNNGIKSALIDLGGNIYALGKKPDGGYLAGDSDWNIGVRDPSKPYGNPALVLSVHDTSIITSGGYERFKIIDGKKYTHFFDFKTGEAIENDLLSATLITPDGSLADGLATAFMASGYEKSVEILKKIPSVGAVLIRLNDEELEIIATENLKENISREKYPLKIIRNEEVGTERTIRN